MSRQNGVKRLVREAHRRSLWQVMILYLGASWAVLEAADHVIQRFGMPDWAYGTAVLLLLIGFPIVMATAIVQEGVGAREAGASSTSASGVGGREAGASTTGDPEPGAPSPDAAETATTAASSGPAATVAHAPGARSEGQASAIHGLLTWRNALLGGVAAFALWGVIATGILLSADRRAADGGRDARGAENLKAIAVLPFDNLSSDAENAHFADGIHEDVLTQLSKIADLTVISRTSVLAYRETELGMSEIAAELGVGSILEGSVRRSGDNVRITAQLIDAGTDQHLWADNFDRALTVANVFAIQTEIAEQIATALRATLSPEEASRIAYQPTDNLGAYDLYLRARELYGRYVDEDNEQAIRLFRRAIEIDPEYADAWAGIADAYGQRILIFGHPTALADSVIALAERAISLNPESAAGYKAKALAHSIRQQYHASLESNLAAVERDPNHRGATNNVGVDYSRLGRLDESLRWYKRGARLDPTTFGPGNVANTYAALGEHERAREYFAEHVDHAGNTPWVRATYGAFVALDGGDADGALAYLDRWRAEYGDLAIMHSFEAEIHLARGDFEAALAAAERGRTLAPEANRVLQYHMTTSLGYATLRAGAAEEGARLLEAQAAENRAAIANGADRPLLWWEMGAIRAALGDPDAALDLMEEAREKGFQAGRAFYAELDPMVASVRDDSRFQAVVADSRGEIEEMRRRIEVEEIATGER